MHAGTTFLTDSLPSASARSTSIGRKLEDELSILRLGPRRTRGRSVAERNRRLSLPLHQDGGPEVDRDPRKGSDLLSSILISILFLLFSFPFITCLVPRGQSRLRFRRFTIAGSPIGARVVVMKLA